MNLQLGSKDLLRLGGIIQKSFSMEDLKHLVQSELDQNLEDFDFSKGLRSGVEGLIQTANQNGWLSDFIVHSLYQRPRDSGLRKFANRVVTPVLGEDFEKLIRENRSFMSAAQWIMQLSLLAKRVCDISFQNQFLGSGFLVAPGVILTSRRVFAELDRNASREFDFVFGNEKERRQTYQGELIVDSNDLSFSLFRLAEFPTAEYGYVDFEDGQPQRRTSIMVVHRPEGKVAMGAVSEFTKDDGLVRFTLNTPSRIVGAPCVDTNLKVVAVVERGEGEFVVGRSIASIRAKLISDGTWTEMFRVQENNDKGSIASSFEKIRRRRSLEQVKSLRVRPYLLAASVLDQFQPEKLSPVGGGAPPTVEIIQEMLPKLDIDVHADGQVSYALKPEERVAILKHFRTRDELAEALGSNPHPTTARQRFLNTFINQEPVSVDRLVPDDLSIAGQVVDWLEGVPLMEPLELPAQREIMRRLNWHRLKLTLESTRGKHFKGRKKTIDALSDFVRGTRDTPQMIWGVGGIGKSALLAQFVLTRLLSDGEPETPFAYLDFERASIAPRDVVGILSEITRQLRYQFSAAESEAEVIEGQLRELKEKYSIAELKPDFPPLASKMADLGRLVTSISREYPSLVLIFDTFEEVQRRSREHVGHLLKLVNALQQHVHSVRLRIIFAGRAEINHPETQVNNTQLVHLEKEDAIACLRSNKIDDQALAEKVYDSVGGHPLILLLASDLLNRSKKENPDQWSFDDSKVQRDLRDQIIQGFLFGRILEHLDDDQIKCLAHPGLILRFVTPTLIRDVIAGPCGLGTLSDQEAEDLYQRLAKETFLVSKEDGTDVLRHRPELRREMLHLMKSVDPDLADEIHQRAIDFFRPSNDPSDRLEELYHRLALGQSSDLIDERWDSSLQDDLLEAIDEFPASSQEYLATRHTGGAESADVDWDSADLHNWQRRTFQRARQLMELGDYAAALDQIQHRSERSDDSPLFPIHIRLLIRLDRWEEAGDLAEAFVARALSSTDLALLLELTLLQCQIQWRLDPKSDAFRRYLARAEDLNRRIGSPMHRAAIALWNRWCNNEVPQEDLIQALSRILSDSVELPSDADRQDFNQLARFLAAELIEVDREIVAAAVDMCGLGSRPELEELSIALGSWDHNVRPSLSTRLKLSPIDTDANSWSTFLHRTNPKHRDHVVAQLIQEPDATEQFCNALAKILSPERMKSSTTQEPTESLLDGILQRSVPPRSVETRPASSELNLDSRARSELRLSSGYLSRIHDALISAFRESDFERFLFLTFPESYDSFDRHRPFTSTVFVVMRWAESHGRLQELVHEASRFYPDNEPLRELSEELAIRFRTTATSTRTVAKQERLKSFLDSISPDGIEKLSQESESLSGLETIGADELALQASNFALAGVARGDSVPAEQLHALEAIVLSKHRPIIDVINSGYHMPTDPWVHLGSGTARDNIQSALASVCRIELPDHESIPIAGTGFVVSDRLIMTCRHTAEIFSNSHGAGYRFRSGQSCRVNFQREIIPAHVPSYSVKQVVMLHPFWDIALLEVEGLGPQHPPLPLSTSPPETLVDRDCVVIGHPAVDPRNDFGLQNRVFRGVYNVKRILPGRIRPTNTIQSFGHQTSALTHDASTLAGNSGAPVLDVETGTVVGIHFASRYLESNFCVPSFELSRDPQLLQFGVNVEGTAPNKRKASESLEKVSAASQPQSQDLEARISVTIEGVTSHFRIPLQ